MSEVLNWFSFKGKKSTDFGVRVELLPPITLAEERVKFKSAVGRSGSIEQTEGDAVFEDMVLTIECYIESLDNLNGIAAWLFGYGDLILPNRPGGHYVGRVIGKIEMERVIKAREVRRFFVDFRVEPYFYLDDSAIIESTETSFAITNPGSVASAPRITIYGHGDIQLAIAGQSIYLQRLEDGIILDTHLMDALTLDGAQLANGHVSGDMPTIPPGVSTVAWLPLEFEDDNNPGTVTRIVIEPRWRCR